MESTWTGKTPRVCVIGAGQAGMAALYYFAKLGTNSPEVVCYDGGSKWGGQWNFTWRTGTDEHGERICSGIYRTMWINLPKESVELPHYTFHQHFKKNTPSYFSAPVMHNYLEGYWKSSEADLSQMIRFNTVVTSVCYNVVTDDFTVVTKDLILRKRNPPETFSHVIVASGIYAVSNPPEFKGFDAFPGRIMHSQQFRGGEEFRGKRILIVGALLSAEDIASQCYKHGAGHVIITWRRKPLGYKWPEGVEERPLLHEVHGSLAMFKDGSSAEVDTIVLCTGYKQSFPFLDDCLRILEQIPDFFPDNLYKGMVWLKGGKNKLLYIGALRCPTPIPLVDVQAVWIVRYITGVNPVNSKDKTPAGLQLTHDAIQKDVDEMKSIFTAIKDPAEVISAHSDYVRLIADDTGYYCKIEEMSAIIERSLTERAEHVLEFRNCQYTSAYTGITSAPPETKWLDNFKDSIDHYL